MPEETKTLTRVFFTNSSGRVRFLLQCRIGVLLNNCCLCRNQWLRFALFSNHSVSDCIRIYLTSSDSLQKMKSIRVVCRTHHKLRRY